MNSSQKAKELVDKFKDFAHGYRAQGYNKQLLENAKQCALIVVEEIMENIKEWDFTNDNSEHHLWFWQQVKEEILKQQ